MAWQRTLRLAGNETNTGKNKTDPPQQKKKKRKEKKTQLGIAVFMRIVMCTKHRHHELKKKRKENDSSTAVFMYIIMSIKHSRR